MGPMLQPLLLTALAMLAFAANSILTRLALAPDPVLIDPASFATVRVLSGAATLWLLLLLQGAAQRPRTIDYKMPIALFVYMVGFSFAYLWLGAGTGALILFGAVQLSMFAVALYEGERFSAMGWLGLALAIGGIVFLIAPGAAAPDPFGALLMIAAGIGWGVYSLLGRKAQDPLGTTAINFVACAPLALVVSVIASGSASATASGLALAIASGAVASGVGYAIWYAALPALTAGRAASVQLSVPVIAALGGAAFLAEPITLRVMIAAVATLGGVALVLLQRRAR